ncbi:hypothetical protein ACFPIJ_32445 [Dactylosporangium cerinum]|uniref:Secreted protein n=1 Tax=Dactylosporangium cerinum TaxID=1434730 RepID=A0ABV9W1S6_9ACTN
MTEALAALGGSVVGGLFTLLGTVLVGRIGLRTEQLRRTAEERTAFTQLVRSQSAEVHRLMIAVQFQIDGVCWLARHAPHRVNPSLLERYETQMQALLPQMAGAMSVLAALDLESHDRLLPWTDELDRLDGDVARLLYGQLDDAVIDQLAALHEQTTDFYRRLPQALGSTLALLAPPADADVD